MRSLLRVRPKAALLLTLQVPVSGLVPVDIPRAAEARILVPSDVGLARRIRIVSWPGDEELARRVADVLASAPALLGLPAEFPTSAVFFLAPDLELWEALTGRRLPDWGAGIAIPSLSRAVIPTFEPAWGGPSGRDRAVRHEWAHLGLHQYLDGLAIPRWFDEGYAQWASGGWNMNEAWRLRVALAGKSAPLDSLRLSWPVDRTNAELAYLLSASAVAYLFEGSGAAGMQAFLSRWRDAGVFEDTFRTTFGTTTAGFERAWVEHIRETYGWVLFASRAAVFWLMAGVVVVVLVRIRRRRDIERVANLRATQPPSQPAYWEGEPVDRRPGTG
jgi:hypothetical protein